MMRLLKRPAGVVGLLGCSLALGVGIGAPYVSPYKPFAIVAPPLSPPNSTFRMGSDALGRDLFSQVLHGARSSLLILGIVATLVLLIGTTVEAWALLMPS